MLKIDYIFSTDKIRDATNKAVYNYTFRIVMGLGRRVSIAQCRIDLNIDPFEVVAMKYLHDTKTRPQILARDWHVWIHK